MALPPVLETQGLAGIRCLAPPLVTSALVLALERWSLTMVIQIQQAALQRFCSTLAAHGTPPSEQTPLFLTATVWQAPISTMLSAPSRCLTTATGSATTPWAIPHCLKTFMALQTLLLVILRSRITIQPGRHLETSTRLLAVRHSLITLMAIQTTLSGFKRWMLTLWVCRITPWAFWP